MTPKVEAALKASPTLYLEIADIGPAGQEAMKQSILQTGLDPDQPLSTKISKEDLAVLDREIKKLGLPEEQAFEPMQPWVVYLTLSVLPAMKAGFDPASGIDRELLTRAEASGKKIRGFETAEEQFHLLADMPQAEQVALLHDELDQLPASVAQTEEMVADWEHGDVAKIAALENDEMKAKHPDIYQKLLVNRNKAIAAKIADILKDPSGGTFFVAVGAGHLAGGDSLQNMLAKDGFVAERLE